MPILIAVDGTESATWRKGNNSFVYKFCSDYRGQKMYLDGPSNAKGLFSVGGIVDKALEFFGQCLKAGAKLSDGVDLVGHSRGGLTVILIAKKMNEDYSSLPIRFLGLYDAVERCLFAEGSATIPENVKLVAHARRDPKAKSRTSFSNCGTRGGQQYEEAFFMGTHSAIGGDPWGGDKPKDLDQAKDTAAAEGADAFIRRWAATVSVPL